MNQQLVEDNIKLVYSLVSKEYPTYLKDEDVIQCGMLGLCKAAERWEEAKGKFSTFATWCIRNEIRQELRSRSKHKGVLSLDYEVDGGNGERVTFGDCIAGEEDVCYIDTDINVSLLTPKEIKVFDLLQTGMSCSDVGRTLGVSVQYVWAVKRKIRKLRENDEHTN